MTTVTLRIQVDKSGASENIRGVKDELKGMGEEGQRSGQQASQGVNGLSSALQGARNAVAAFLAVYAGIQALSGVVRLADEYQGLSDRLRLATSGSAEFAAAQAGVFAIAQQTGTALSSVNSLYVGLANSTRDLGLSQGELQTITQAVSQSFVVSGTNAANSSSAILQLSQAFASGVLRGDEFNSVMENAPGLAAALSESLGKTRGELRAMAEAGELTAEVLSGALLDAAPAIATQFGQMGQTVGRAFQTLSNAVLQFVGEANQASGAGAALARGITAVANNVDEVARAMGALAVALGVFFGARGLAALAVGFQSIATSIALSAAPIGSFIIGANTATIATGALTLAGRTLFTLVGGWVGILAGLTAGIYYLATAQTEAEKTAEAADEAIRNLRTATGDLKPAALDAAQAQLILVDAMLETARAALVSTEAVQRSMQESSSALEDNAFALALQGNAANDARGEVNLLASSAQRLREEIARAQGIDPIVTLQDIGVLQAAESIMGAFGVSIAGVRRETLGAIPPALRLIETTDAKVRAFRAAQDALEKERAEMAAMRASVTATIPVLGALVTKNLDMQRSFEGVTGSIEVFYDATEDAAAVAEQWAKYWGDAVGSVTDAFGDFVASGFKSFKDFGDQLKRIAQQIVSDLVSTFLRSRITIPITAALTGGSGSALAGGLTGGGGSGILGTLGSLLGLGGGLFGSLGAATGAATAGGAFAGAVASGSAGFSLGGAGIAGLLGPIALLGGAIAALSAIFSDNQETILRVRSQEFNGDRRARGIEQSALGSIFVRGETLGDGAAVEIAGRIRDFDNIIAGLLNDEQLAAVRLRLENVNDTFRDGAANVESALSSRFGAILSVLDENVQEFVGTTGTLDERVVRLADAMTIMSAAATGLISDDFDEVAGVLTRFRIGGEGLSDTFGRIVSGMSLVDDALLMLNGRFAGTRLQAATFAGELIELSGGLDAFAQRLGGALQVLFTDDERNEFLAAQAQSALNTALTGLNITGTGIESIRTQLRDALRAALETGNAALVDQILTAANALGAFGTAVEALGEDAVAAAQATAFGGTSLTPGGGVTSPAGATAAGTPVATQLEASQAAARALERHTGLLERIALNTERGTGDVGEKSARDTADAGRASAATLREIKTLIEAAVRTQTQEGLKRTTGANKRTSAA